MNGFYTFVILISFIKSTAMQVFTSVFSSNTSTVDEILQNAAISSCFSYLDQYLCFQKKKKSQQVLTTFLGCSVLSISVWVTQIFLDTHLFYSNHYAVVERLWAYSDACHVLLAYRKMFKHLFPLCLGVVHQTVEQCDVHKTSLECKFCRIFKAEREL